jgi:type I restriction enzyme R subunit
MIDALIEQVNDNNVDEFDLLNSIGFDSDVVSKEDRIKNVENSEELNNYNDMQKEVIEELLNTYRNNGVTELEKIKTLNIKNFNKFGGLVKIVNNIFGGKDKYIQMIKKLENKLYS